MNREIKFRIWHKEFQKFITDTNEWFLDLDGNLCFYDTTKTFGAGLVKLHPARYVIQEFTGLKDKNGKEIYEGDILKVNYMTNQGIGKVVYEKCGFQIRSRWGASFYDTIPTIEHSEIIGNIFENPELLK